MFKIGNKVVLKNNKSKIGIITLESTDKKIEGFRIKWQNGFEGWYYKIELKYPDLKYYIKQANTTKEKEE